ncbi:unknown [Bacteroides sp. CAG:754]|nr:unknown [Bacteroides sp. CAG:754]
MRATMHLIAADYSVAGIIDSRVARRIQIVSACHDNTDVFYIMYIIVLHSKAIDITCQSHYLTRSGMHIVYFALLYYQVANRFLIAGTQRQYSVCATPVSLSMRIQTHIFDIINLTSANCNVARLTVDVYTFRIGIGNSILRITYMQIFQRHVLDIPQLHQCHPSFQFQSCTIYPCRFSRIAFDGDVLA